MTLDSTKWASILTKPERLLMRRLRELDDDEAITLEELVVQLRLSKTAIRLALASLTEHGFLAVTPREVPDDGSD